MGRESRVEGRDRSKRRVKRVRMRILIGMLRHHPLEGIN